METADTQVVLKKAPPTRTTKIRKEEWFRSAYRISQMASKSNTGTTEDKTTQALEVSLTTNNLGEDIVE